MVDLHCFDHLQSQFLLRYIIGYKLKNLIWINKMTCVLLLVKEKHNNAGITSRYSLKEFVKKELQKFEPPIHVEPHWTNLGIWIIPKKQLLPYLNNEINYATEKLTKPQMIGIWMMLEMIVIIKI